MKKKSSYNFDEKQFFKMKFTIFEKYLNKLTKFVWEQFEMKHKNTLVWFGLTIWLCVYLFVFRVDFVCSGEIIFYFEKYFERQLHTHHTTKWKRKELAKAICIVYCKQDFDEILVFMTVRQRVLFYTDTVDHLSAFKKFRVYTFWLLLEQVQRYWLKSSNAHAHTFIVLV